MKSKRVSTIFRAEVDVDVEHPGDTPDSQVVLNYRVLTGDTEWRFTHATLHEPHWPIGRWEPVLLETWPSLRDLVLTYRPKGVSEFGPEH